MSNLKKVLALVVVFTMLCGTMVFASPFTDVEDDATYAEAVTMLSYLGILNGYEDGTFKPDATITRAEMAAVITRAMGSDDTAKGSAGNTAFTDVAADHWASGYVNYASAQQIINGMGDGTFAPENPVTYEQAVKMIVCALGYGPMAEYMGGFPTGYLAVASNVLKITKGATGTGSEPAKRAVVARLVFNSLDVGMMIQTSWNPSNPVYKIPEADESGYKTLLKDYLEVDKVEGVITDTQFTDATANEVDKDNEVFTIDAVKVNGQDIDDVDFDGTDILVGETNVASLLGYRVVAYITASEDVDKEVLAVAPQSGYNTTVTIDVAQYEKVNAKDQVEYYGDRDNDKKTTKLDIADEIVYVENNVVDEYTVDATDLADAFKAYGEDTVVDGTITFVDNNKDGDYDYVIVKEFGANYIVDKVNETKKTVAVVGGGNISLDEEAEDQYLVIYKDGAVASFADITPDSVITVVSDAAKLGSAKVVEAYISTKSVEGKVTKVSKDGKYTIAGKAYQLSDDSEVSSLAIGDSGVFYLNVNDKIVYSDEIASTSAGSYGYVLDAAMGTDSSDPFADDTVRVQLITSEGKKVIYTVSEKADIYTAEASYTKVDDLESLLAALDNTLFDTTYNTTTEVGTIEKVTDKGVEDYVVKYDLNSDNQISKLYFQGADKMAAETLTSTYVADDEAFKSAKVPAITADTVTFVIAEGVTAATIEADDITVTAATSAFKDGVKYTFVGLDEDENTETLGAIAVQTGVKGITVTNSFVVVEDVYESTNEDDDVILVIEGYMDGEEVVLNSVVDYEEDLEVIVDGEKTIDLGFGDDKDVLDLVAGDVIIVETNAAGEVEKMEILFTTDAALDKASTGKILSVDEDEENNIDAYDEFYGYVGEVKNSGVYLYDAFEFTTDAKGNPSTEYSDTEITAISVKATKFAGDVYVVDTTGSKVRVNVGDVSDIVANNAVEDDGVDYPAYMVFTRTVDDIATDIVVYLVDGDAFLAE